MLDGGREPESVEESERLGGDTVYSAVDDADERDHETTRNLRNGKHHFFFLGIDYLITARRPEWAEAGVRP